MIIWISSLYDSDLGAEIVAALLVIIIAQFRTRRDLQPRGTKIACQLLMG